MARERKGFITNRNGKLYARVGYTDDQGRRRGYAFQASTEVHFLANAFIYFGVPPFR